MRTLLPLDARAAGARPVGAPRAPILLVFCLLLATAAAGAAPPAFDQAVALFQARRYPDAGDAFAQIAAADPKNAEACCYLGRLALLRGDDNAAVTEFERATALAPQNSAYFFWLGNVDGRLARDHHSFSRGQKCRRALLRAVELDPGNLDARAALVTFYRLAPFFVGGSLAKARFQAAEIAQRDPLRGALALGEICVAEKKYDEAVANYQNLLRAHPEQITALYMIGYVAAISGRDLPEGAAALRQYLTRTPDGTQPGLTYAHLRLGDILERQHDPAAARAEYQAALALEPKFEPAVRALARLP